MTPSEEKDVQEAADLTTPYKPMAVHYPVADILEYVQRDESTVAQPVQAGLDVLVTMDTREPIGWRIYGWSRIAPALQAAEQERDRLAENLTEMTGRNILNRNAVEAQKARATKLAEEVAALRAKLAEGES